MMRIRLALGLVVLSCLPFGCALAANSPSADTTDGSRLGSSRGPLPSLRRAPQQLTLSASLAAGPPDAIQGPSPAPPVLSVTAPAQPKPQDPPRAVTVSQDPQPTLDTATFINTMRAAWTYKRLAEGGGWPALPVGTVLTSGARGPLVTALRRRLALEGDLPADKAAGELFDPDLTAAVKRFQARHGLPESGAVRKRTLDALNVPALTRHRQLVASAGRLMGSHFAFGSRYVVVNIPAATVEAVEDNRVERRYVAVVGKTDRPSPRIEAHVTAVNLNPTWTVPVSLIKKDIIPKMRSDPAYLTKMKIRILDGKGQEIDPRTLDWSTQKAANYTLRQDPGAINSLGQIRIDMPNKEAVYMHDTPAKRLFAQDVRFHSSGCVRVAEVTDLAEWLLRGTAGPAGTWTRAGIEAAIATNARQDLRLAKSIPVAWVYLTGYATADGTVHFRDDVYGLDGTDGDAAPSEQVPDVPATASVSPKPSR